MEYVTSQGIVVTNRVFVGSIPDWMCENKLHLAFQDLNFNVQDTRIVVDMKTGTRRGYGFVTFYNSEDAEELVKKGYVITKDGVKLKVDTAVRKKGLQLRLKRLSQDTSNMFTLNNVAYPMQLNNQIQPQIPYAYHVPCGCTVTPNQPTYYNYGWETPTTNIVPYTMC